MAGGSTFNIGLKSIRKLVEEKDALGWYKAKLSEQLFKGVEVDIYKWVASHIGKYHSLPTFETLAQQFPEIKEAECPEPTKYYVDLLDRRFVYDSINQCNIDSQTILKEDKSKVDDAEKVLKDTLDRITQQRYRSRILNVGQDAPKLVLSAYQSASKDARVTFGWPYMDNMTGGAVGGDVVSFVGRPAAGKAQPLDSKVLTLRGFKLMGDLQVGDELASVDGKPSKVEAVYPQGKKPVFRLTFQDGRTCEASDEHLWEVHYREWSVPKIETTLQLIARLKSARYKNRLSVRLFTGEYGREWEYLIDPYTLGALIGDGCFRANDPRFTSEDPEIISRVSEGLNAIGCELKHIKNYDYSVVCPGQTENELKSRLKSLGLWGLKSEDKHLPESCFLGTRQQRLALLQGLMDTDGTAAKNGGQSFCSSSKVLAEQVQNLVRSLGGKATINLKKTPHLDAWIVHVALEDRSGVFSLPRKVARSTPRTTHTNHRLTLTAIEFVGDKECQCIQVSHPDRLYVTDDYVVTHNTWKVLKVALHNWLKGRNVLFASMEMNHLAIAQRIVSMYTHVSASDVKNSSIPTMSFGGNASAWTKFLKGLGQMPKLPGQFYVVDGNLAAYADDLYMLAAQLKCDAIFIDGAYLMRHRNARLDRFTKVAENVELMKQLGTDLEIPTFASWQFNRQAAKKGKGLQKNEKAGLEDIGYSDAIPQVSSIVMGLHQEEGIETMNQRIIDVMKGRNGEIGQFAVHWDFQTMNFDEISAESEKIKEEAELQYA